MFTPKWNLHIFLMPMGKTPILVIYFVDISAFAKAGNAPITSHAAHHYKNGTAIIYLGQIQDDV